MEKEKLVFYIGKENLFEITGIKDTLIYTPNEEESKYFVSTIKEIRIMVFETSTWIDFVKILTDNNLMGIRAESMWANYTYPQFEKKKQSLINNIKLNDMPIICDLINYSNEATGEKKDIYFDITDFFGKY